MSETQKVTLLESDLPKMVCSGQLSKATSFTLRVEGPFTQREAKALLFYMQAQIDVLSEDDSQPRGIAPKAAQPVEGER